MTVEQVAGFTTGLSLETLQQLQELPDDEQGTAQS